VWSDQSAYDVRVEWGADGLAVLAGDSDAVIIVDVLSFSTCVDVAVGRGASVFPFPPRGDDAAAFAKTIGAECAAPRGSARFSLSPATFASIRSGEKVVLPSPNGAALSAKAGTTPTFAGCPRNAVAVVRAATQIGRRVAVIAAGERWPSGTLRPALEDWIGAGAIIGVLPGARSPEADAAAAAFEAVASRLESVFLDGVSGRQLIELGYRDDVVWAAALNVSDCAPRLREGAFVDGRASRGSSVTP
jgi:2-phosphosulfolactate phosphatase